MLNFLRLLAALIVGVVIGAAAVLLLQPTFSIVVTNAPAGVTTLVDTHAPVVEEPEFTPAPPPAGAAPAPAPVTAAPASPPPAAAAPAAVDYAQVAARASFWPPSVSAVVPSVITFDEQGKKTEEMKIAAGTSMPLSNVLPDGTLELRSQGRKFNLHARYTDFDVLVRKKAQELIARAAGTTAVEPAPPAPAAAVAPAPVAPPKPRGPQTLQQKLDALYGRAAQADAASTVPSAGTVAPAAPTPGPSSPPVAPAPAGTDGEDRKAKDADLKKKMEGLFKPPAGPAR